MSVEWTRKVTMNSGIEFAIVRKRSGSGISVELPESILNLIGIEIMYTEGSNTKKRSRGLVVCCDGKKLEFCDIKHK